MSSLAIVIPCFKNEFLRKSLLSLVAQTDHNFVVYIGDDCSPYDIKEICDEFKNAIKIVYHRFEENLGGRDLVAHWERCVKLIKNEAWIWIFADDDIAENTCVEAFYKALSETKEVFDVYRFNTCIIDRYDNFVGAAKESPTVEDAMELAYNILLQKRGNSMPDHIFKRDAYIAHGGVINFIQAQGSDWATSINFAYKKGLYTIAGPKVKWRKSGLNISSTAYKTKTKLIYGYLQFIDWVTRKFSHEDECNSSVTLEQITEASRNNLQSVIKSHYHGIPYTEIFSVANKIHLIYNEPFLKSFKFCLKINYDLLKSRYYKLLNSKTSFL